MDDIDRAQIREEHDREAAIEAARQREGVSALMIEGLPCCRDCAQPIPLARLNVYPHAPRCIECQARHELRHEQRR